MITLTNLLAQDDRSLGDFAGSLVLVGAGNMGSAMLNGWLNLGLDFHRVVLIEPQPSLEIATFTARGARLNPEPADIEDASVVVLAVKPQVAPHALPAVQSWVGPSTLVISIMAGRTLKFLQSELKGRAVVRAMPNTAAAVGRGITVAVANRRVSEGQRVLAHKLLAAIGLVEWVKDEGLLDAVTAVSGSGPAYVFLLTESLARAGAAAGLPSKLAARLARATVAGAGELLHRSQAEPGTLRENVTSPGGTTAAALQVLMAPRGLDPLMKRAVAAATKRSRELAG
jgi:pyrroline-5-carboxylate reductase